MSTETADLESREATGADRSTIVDVGPLGSLPRLSRRQIRLAERVAGLVPEHGLPPALTWLAKSAGGDFNAGRAEVLWRASGLRRPGMIAQLSWRSRGTRIGLGIETPVAHALVDRLLGFDRLDAEGRLQLTPVEWGVLTFAVARTIERMPEASAVPTAVDLAIDRVGPDPFDVTDLGNIVTVHWPARLGKAAGSIRLWLPEHLVSQWLEWQPPALDTSLPTINQRLCELGTVWRAEAGSVSMPRGLGRLRVGGVLPLIESPLRGTPQNPAGSIELTLSLTGEGGRYWITAEPVSFSGGGRVRMTGPLNFTTTPREPVNVNPAAESSQSAAAGATPPTDVPVTLVIELGRVNLPLGRLADLKPGDVVELGRHSREPVELTSGGRLVARGELVQIDTELGVRVTNVFL